MLTGLDENKLRNCKVRIHPGARIKDMYYHLGSHLRKKPSKVILLIGTNDCVDDSWSQVVEKLIQLKIFIDVYSPGCHVIFATLITRYDNYNSQQVVHKVNGELIKMDVNILKNYNFERSHIGKRGLHLSSKGIGKLITNFVNFLKSC